MLYSARIAVGIFLWMLITSAHALIIDLEDTTLGTFQNTTRSSHGFNIAHTGSFAFVGGNSGQGATDFSGNGTVRVISFNVSTLTLSAAGGSPFDISSFEGGESWVFQPHTWATQIQAVGSYVGGGTTTQTFALDLIKNPLTGMQLFQFNSTFQNLQSVAFSGIGGNPEFSLDNFNVSVVPVPGSLLLIGLGLLALRTRRQPSYCS